VAIVLSGTGFARILAEELAPVKLTPAQLDV